MGVTIATTGCGWWMRPASWRSSIEFTEAAFPDYLWYHFGNLHDEKGTPNPREQWTYGIDERLFAALRDQGLTRRQRYGLFGHSAGGQFVHRMLSFGFRDRVAVAVSANAGTYAMPTWRLPGRSGWARPNSMRKRCVRCWSFRSR